MEEKDLQTRLLKLNFLDKVWIRKIHCDEVQGSGIPDLLACIKGKFYGIETKFGTELHGGQEINLREIAQAEGQALVLDTLPKVEKFIQEVYEECHKT